MPAVDPLQPSVHAPPLRGGAETRGHLHKFKRFLSDERGLATVENAIIKVKHKFQVLNSAL